MALVPTIICDGCDTHYMINIDKGEVLPPRWMAIEINIANKYGSVESEDSTVMVHFCSSECLSDYANSDALKKIIVDLNRSEENDVN